MNDEMSDVLHPPYKAADAYQSVHKALCHWVIVTMEDGLQDEDIEHARLMVQMCDLAAEIEVKMKDATP